MPKLQLASCLLAGLTLAQLNSPADPPFSCSSWQRYVIGLYRSSTCFLPEEVAATGFIPSERDGTRIVVEMHDHPSGRILPFVSAIIGEELMGYDIDFICVQSSFNAAHRIANGYSDLMLEYQYNVFETEITPYIQQQSVLDVGPIGYSVQAGFWIPNYMQSIISLLNLGSFGLNEFVTKSYDSYLTYTLPKIVQFLATQNDTEEMAGIVINNRFTPPWCAPYSIDGVGNNCLDVKAESIQFDKGIMQQMIINLKLNFTMSFLGNDAAVAFMLKKVAKGLPFMVKSGYVPKGYLRTVLGPAAPSLTRINFKPWSQECYSGNTNSLDGIGSVDCDFPIITLRKIGNPRVAEAPPKSPLEDFSFFLRRLKFDQSLIEDLWMESMSSPTSNDYLTACNFLKQNISLWAPWVQNSYEAPNRVTFEFGETARISVFTLSAIAITLCLAVAVLLLIYRNHEMIKGISKLFSLMSILGFAITIGSANLFTSSKPSSAICSAEFWLPPLGITIALSALGAKTYRIHRIFTKTLNNPALLTDIYLMRIAIIPCAIMVIVLGFWQGFDPSLPETVEVTEGNTIITYHVCSFNSGAYFTVVALLAIEVLAITKLAYDARFAPEQFNEAKELGVSMYNMMMSGLVCIPLILWLEGKKDYFVLNTIIILFLILPASIAAITLFGFRLSVAVCGLSEQTKRMRQASLELYEIKIRRDSARTSFPLSATPRLSESVKPFRRSFYRQNTPQKSAFDTNQNTPQRSARYPQERAESTAGNDAPPTVSPANRLPLPMMAVGNAAAKDPSTKV